MGLECARAIGDEEFTAPQHDRRCVYTEPRDAPVTCIPRPPKLVRGSTNSTSLLGKNAAKPARPGSSTSKPNLHHHHQVGTSRYDVQFVTTHPEVSRDHVEPLVLQITGDGGFGTRALDGVKGRGAMHPPHSSALDASCASCSTGHKKQKGEPDSKVRPAVVAHEWGSPRGITGELNCS